jgi:hypothetical protein
VIADRTNDAALAETAVRQQLPRAWAIRDNEPMR